MAMQTCNYTKILLIIFIINIFLIGKILCTTFNSGMDAENYKILQDMPVKHDLNEYLESLEKLITFGLNYKHHVDMNFEFGLFLINVHLKPILKIKHDKISIDTYKRLEKMLYENDELIHYFHHMVNNMPARLKKTESHRIAVKITSLFSNETLWSHRKATLTHDLIKQTERRTRYELQRIYSKPKTYELEVFNFEKGIPSPKLSDRCISHLAENAVHDGLQSPKCQLPEYCRQMLKESTELGYFITHKLLHLLAAHLGRGCVVFSYDEDASTMRGVCTTIYDEAHYIAMNNYSIKDLLIEEVALCSLSGHAQFLRRTWISEILRFQTHLGCFGDNITDSKHPRIKDVNIWRMTETSNEILGGFCNTHFTAVTAAAVAAAVRYILETY